ncbi:hypothetical protein M501DRAFT_759277 [Patellaria atrata CBS 101060]|uniref:Ankyrin n=1 Tax=Patellaria atrata CBS 101060 TaxID=1346257 RepID=A0A9P4SC03_9PEZI|nr:hypothetical protein M501DRAFT_759277 [Patellaria atrata CBS 101060]
MATPSLLPGPRPGLPVAPHVTPITILKAAEAGKADVVRYLLDLGANTSIGVFYGRTAKGCAEKHGKSEIIEILKSHTNRNADPTSPVPSNSRMQGRESEAGESIQIQTNPQKQSEY